jgi:hypothetical protein
MAGQPFISLWSGLNDFFKGGNSMLNDHCLLVIDKWFSLLPLKKGGERDFREGFLNDQCSLRGGE